jgi:drug/metabolite transporter (DMT)-like permease
MSWVAIVIIIISSFAHATWNLIGKRESPSIAFFFLTNAVGVVIGLPILVLSLDILVRIPRTIWILLIATGFFQMVYFSGLASAYKKGDMSVVYPLARSSPIIVVTFVSLFLGRAHQISMLCMIGITLVVSGCFLVPMKRFTDLQFSNYLNQTCLLALIAAVGTAGYSIIDDEALRVLRTIFRDEVHIVWITFLYIVLDVIMTCLWFSLPVLLFKNETRELKRILKKSKKYIIGAGVIMFFTYLLVLIAMAFSKNVSYVVGFRQISILISVILGVVLLKEKPYLPKLAGSIIIFVGLVLVGVG